MSTPEKIREALCNNDIEYDISLKFEQYKLAVEMADRISARRLTANSFFLTLNTGIVAITGYLSLSANAKLAIEVYWVVALAGMVLCYMWYRLVCSYRDLNTAKFAVIHQIEKDLPYKIYDAEWEAVDRGGNPKKYLSFTKIEMSVPWVFFTIHIIVLIKVILIAIE